MLELRQITALLIAGIVLQVAVQVFSGASATMIAPDQTGTAASIAGAAASSIGPPNWSVAPAGADYLYLGTGQNSIAAEKLVNTNSLLYNNQITTLNATLSKSGNPYGIATLGSFDSSGVLKKSFGTINATTITTTDANYTGTSTSYTMPSGERLGVKYTAATPPTDYIASSTTALTLNGSTQSAAASSNSVFNITTESFSVWGYFYRQTDSGLEETIARKKVSTSDASAGYAIRITTSDKLNVVVGDGSTTVNVSTTANVTTGRWYFFGVSADRAGSLNLVMYDIQTGILSNPSSSIAALSSTWTNTQIFTVGKNSNGANAFFPGMIRELHFKDGTALAVSQLAQLATNPNLITATSSYAFNGNLNDSTGTNNLTGTGTPTFTAIQTPLNHYVTFNGSSQQARAQNSTIFDVTSQDFSMWGHLVRHVDSGGEETIARKKASTSTASAGWAVRISNNDFLSLMVSNGTTSDNLSINQYVQLDHLYFWAISVDRDGDMILWLYDTVADHVYSQRFDVSNFNGQSLSNSETFTLARSSNAALAYCNCDMDNVNIAIGKAITYTEFDTLKFDPYAVAPTSRYNFDINATDSMTNSANTLTLANGATFTKSSLGDTVKVKINTNDPFDSTIPYSGSINTNYHSTASPRIGWVRPVFTASAYRTDGGASGGAVNAFYKFYDLHASPPPLDRIVTGSDLQYLTSTIEPYMISGSTAAGWQMLQLQTPIAAAIPNAVNTVLTDMHVSNGTIFNDDGSNKYDIMITAHTEYVTDSEYNNYMTFVNQGGKLILLDGNNFYAKITWNATASPQTITLVDGHNWNFNGTLAKWSQGEHYLTTNAANIGSNYLYNNNPEAYRFGVDPFGYDNPAVEWENNYVSNFPNDVIITDYKIRNGAAYGSTVATYYKDYGQGRFIHLGIFGERVVNDTAFQNYFVYLMLKFAMGDTSFTNPYDATLTVPSRSITSRATNATAWTDDYFSDQVQAVNSIKPQTPSINAGSNNFWENGIEQESNGNIYVNLGSQKSILSVSLTMPSTLFIPSTIGIYGSNDANSWALIRSVNPASTTSAQSFDISSTDGVNYRYVKFQVDTWGTAKYWRVSNIGITVIDGSSPGYHTYVTTKNNIWLALTIASYVMIITGIVSLFYRFKGGG